MHELQRACETFLTICNAIDTSGLSLEMEHLSSTGSCPYAKRD
jgi:hypothetical protein